jgi:DNA-binding MarR family transcriptional regulator
MLTILYEGPAHGYNIMSKFKKRVGKKISPSLVYPFLKRLEQKNLVKYTVKSIGEKEKKIFELTNEGREFCKKLFKRFAHLVSVAIEPSLDVCAHCGAQIYQGGHKELIGGLETMFCCVHCFNSQKQG